MWKYRKGSMELEILCLIEFVAKFNVKNQRFNLCYKTKIKYVHCNKFKKPKNWSREQLFALFAILTF